MTALDEHGHQLAHKKQPKKRRYTHAVIMKVETERRVGRRYTARAQADRELIEALHSELAGAPTVRRAGDATARMVAIHPPTIAKAYVEVVYAPQASKEDAVARYIQAVQIALAHAQERLTEALRILEQLDEGVYELKTARVLHWCTSRDNARLKLRIAATEPWELMGLMVTECA